MTNLEQKPVSRRGFLRGFSVVGAAALLTACGAPQAASPTAKPAAAPPTAKPAAAPPTAPPVAPPTTAPAAKAAEPKPTDASPAGADWDQLVAAAKKEGTLAAVTGAGSAYRRVLDLFQEAFPG